MDTRKPYTIDEGGVAHTYLLDDDMAHAWNLEEPDAVEGEADGETEGEVGGEAGGEADGDADGEVDAGADASKEEAAAPRPAHGKRAVPEDKQVTPENK